MADYYQILKVSNKASNQEIKSAYRRLARKLHPDVNGGSEDTAREFAAIAKAYEIIGNPQNRADYDRKLLDSQYKINADGSVFNSQNQHARKWRQRAYEKRYNDIIDRMIADERRETLAFQKAIFPTVALFSSTLIVAVFKPVFFANSAIIGKIVFISLFVVSLIHIASRVKAGFERYTYNDEAIHDAILAGEEPESKPYSRAAAISFLLFGTAVCLGIGLLIGNFFATQITTSMPGFFSASLNFEFIFYPPVVVLLVDGMHAFASHLENSAT